MTLETKKMTIELIRADEGNKRGINISNGALASRNK